MSGGESPALPAFAIEPLAEHHDRSAFRSGSDALDRYLKTQAGQDAKRKVAAPFVLTLPPSLVVAGYYTLSNAALRPSELPPALVKRLPRYPALPATLLGRLAVDEGHKGRRLGRLLLLDALQRCLRAEIASMAVVVDAKDDAAQHFYLHHDFISLADAPNRLFLPMARVVKLFV